MENTTQSLKNLNQTIAFHCFFLFKHDFIFRYFSTLLIVWRQDAATFLTECNVDFYLEDKFLLFIIQAFLAALNELDLGP